MSILNLEELESRHLPSAGYVLPRPTAAQAVSDSRSGVLERSTISSFGGGLNLEIMLGSGWGPTELRFDSGPTEVIWVITVRFADRPDDGPAGDGGAPVSAAATAVNPKPVGTDPGTVAAADATVGRAAAVAPAARAAGQTPVALNAATQAIAGEFQGPIAGQIPIRAVHVVDGGTAVMRPGAGDPLRLDTRTQGMDGPRSPGQAEPAADPPAAPALEAGLLSSLPVMDLTALGRGLEHFLARVEHVGEELIGEGDGLRPWLVAGAAAATACEIARRQLRQAAEAAVEVHPNYPLAR